jgi:hypothetical protein
MGTDSTIANPFTLNPKETATYELMTSKDNLSSLDDAVYYKVSYKWDIKNIEQNSEKSSTIK